MKKTSLGRIHHRKDKYSKLFSCFALIIYKKGIGMNWIRESNPAASTHVKVTHSQIQCRERIEALIAVLAEGKGITIIISRK